MEITTPIVSSILSHEGGYTNETIADQLSAVTEVRKRKRERLALNSLPTNDGQFQVFADFEYFIFDELLDNFSRFYGFKQSFFMILQVT